MDWLVARRRVEDDRLPPKVQINKLQIRYIEVYDDHISIFFSGGSYKDLYFKEWDISF